jgi:hypothetical protein
MAEGGATMSNPTYEKPLIVKVSIPIKVWNNYRTGKWSALCGLVRHEGKNSQDAIDGLVEKMAGLLA